MWNKPNCPSASESALPTRERFGAVERGSPIANPRAGNDVPQKLCGIAPSPTSNSATGVGASWISLASMAANQPINCPLLDLEIGLHDAFFARDPQWRLGAWC